MRRWIALAAVYCVVLGHAAMGDEPEAMPAATSPADSLSRFRVKPGLRIELVAAEPLVESPVAIDFGGDGRLWVCEMRDYPTGIDGHWKPGGAIKVLEDRDHDGRYDTATVFLDGLPFPTGVMAWKKGALICAAPDILYAEDTDGDGKADVRRVLFHGFATENFQARVNGLSYNLDNWVYGANGLIGGSIRGTATGREVNIGGRDFRIQPETGLMEPASGLTQQGRIHDDWGNQFGGNNSILIQHYPFPDHYSRRNPRVASPPPAVVLTSGADANRLYPASQTVDRYNHPESANRVTSACGAAIYRDSLLGPAYAGNAFICEPVHNLVHREVLEPRGVTFESHRAIDEADSEFLGSTDPWFRPVQALTGPDGALWIVDMYRFVIEHPRWISPEKLAGIDVRAGADRGRIYRVVADGQPLRPVPRLDLMPTGALVSALDTPNGTRRDTVQRLLVDRGDKTAVPALTEMLRTGAQAVCRVQALGALAGLGAIDAHILIGALADPHPGVRREAVRLSEAWFGREDGGVGETLLAMTGDRAATVRYQLAASLGEWDDPRAGAALGAIALGDGADLWVRAAVLSSSTRHAASVLETVLAKSNEPMLALVEPLLATLSASRDRVAIARALAAIEKAGQGKAWRLGAIAQLLEAAPDATLADDPAVRSSIAAARALAGDTTAQPGDRATALRLLGRGKTERDSDRGIFSARLEPSEPTLLQLGAVGALARLDDRPSDAAMIAHWSRLGPSVRAALLDALLARPASSEALVAALESKQIAPMEIDAAHRQRLLSAGTEPVRRRAQAVFASRAIGARQEVLKTFESAKTQTGDAERGKAVFSRLCAACHKFAGLGHEVGPDLAALTDLTPEALSIAILDPNREVDARYAGYTAALKDGRLLSGLIAGETASAITLKRQEGQSDVILRADLDELATSGQSLMPEGLENDLKPSELADLIAFVAGGADRPKRLAGNEPRRVQQEADGTIRLPASAAEIFGPSLTFETPHGNLGDWHDASDRAAWSLRVDRPATFTVTMDWACADESAGNAFLIRVGNATIRGAAGGTGAGTWANYRSIFLGEVTLPAGTHRLEFRAAGPVKGALLDLKSVTLTPRSEGVFPAKKP